MIRIEKVENEIFDMVFENVKDYNEYLNDYVIPVFGKNVDRVSKETLKVFKLIEDYELVDEVAEFDYVGDMFEVGKDFEFFIRNIVADTDKKDIDLDLVDYVKIVAYYTGTSEVLGSRPTDDSEIYSITGLKFENFHLLRRYGYEEYKEMFV